MDACSGSISWNTVSGTYILMSDTEEFLNIRPCCVSVYIYYWHCGEYKKKKLHSLQISIDGWHGYEAKNVEEKMFSF
jgi:hypothetical protein